MSLERVKSKELFTKFIKDFNLQHEETDESHASIVFDERKVISPYPTTFFDLVMVLLACTMLLDPKIPINESISIISLYLDENGLEQEFLSPALDTIDGLLEKITSEKND